METILIISLASTITLIGYGVAIVISNYREEEIEVTEDGEPVGYIKK